MTVRRSPINHPRRAGFTLVEILVGIAVGSLLILVAVQLLVTTAGFNERLRVQQTTGMQIVSLNEQLIRDFVSEPVTDHPPQYFANKWVTTVPSKKNEQSLRLDTRIRYRRVKRDTQLLLVRDYRWQDIEQRNRQPEVLLRADDQLELSIWVPGEGWISKPEQSDLRPAGLRIRWDEQIVTIPLRRDNPHG